MREDSVGGEEAGGPAGRATGRDRTAIAKGRGMPATLFSHRLGQGAQAPTSPVRGSARKRSGTPRRRPI